MLNPDASVTESNKASTGNDRPKGYAGMPAKSGFLLLETDCQLIRDNSHIIREALFACTTKQQVECAVAFARYLSFAGLNSGNFWLFLRLIMTNNPWVVDELLHDRIPRLLFSTIRPDGDLIDAAFEMLFSRHPNEIYEKSLESVLGIIQNAYFDPDDGYRIRKLTMMDINALGKFLIKDQPQDHPLNKLILEILDKMSSLGAYYGEQDKNVLSKHAFNVRYAYFDHTRDLVDAIPEPLLVRMNDISGVPPEEDYANLASIRRTQKRDVHGRFMKNSEGPDSLVMSPGSSSETVVPETYKNPVRPEKIDITQVNPQETKTATQNAARKKPVEKKSGGQKAATRKDVPGKQEKPKPAVKKSSSVAKGKKKP